MDPYTLLDFRLDPDPCTYGNEYRTLGILSEAFLFYFQIEVNIYSHGLEAKDVRLIRRKETGRVGIIIVYGSELASCGQVVEP